MDMKEIDAYIKDYHAEDYQKNKEHYRKHNKPHYLKRYGIDIDKYNEMFESQEGRCAICGIHQSELKVSLCVDHNHSTGEIRGLLCKRCNSAIGLFDENSDSLGRAIEYLKQII